jgi:hypothetical protein
MGFDREPPRGAGARTDAGQGHAGVPGKRTLTEALPLLRKAADAPAEPAADAEQAVARAATGSGAPLGGDIRGKVEHTTGADLGGVRVHTGAESQAAAAAVGARAFTVGQDVHFGSGEYQPGTHSGDQLIAHELAHTVQQAGGAAVRQHKLAVSAPGDAAEREADAVADAALAGRTTAVTPLGAGAVMRDPAKKDPDPALLTDFDAKFKGAAAELHKSPASLQLIKEAAAAGVKFGGYAEDGPGKNAWAYTIGDTIYVPKARTDLTLAISDYLFELNNAVRKPQFDKIHEEGAKGSKGKLTAEQYATQKVQLEVEGMLRLGEIWVEMRKGMGDGPELDKYDGEFYRAEYKAFKDGTKTKDDLVQSVLSRKYTSGANAGKTVKEYYMEQYKQISGGK